MWKGSICVDLEKYPQLSCVSNCNGNKQETTFLSASPYLPALTFLFRPLLQWFPGLGGGGWYMSLSLNTLTSSESVLTAPPQISFCAHDWEWLCYVNIINTNISEQVASKFISHSYSSWQILLWWVGVTHRVCSLLETVIISISP